MVEDRFLTEEDRRRLREEQEQEDFPDHTIPGGGERADIEVTTEDVTDTIPGGGERADVEATRGETTTATAVRRGGTAAGTQESTASADDAIATPESGSVRLGEFGTGGPGTAAGTFETVAEQEGRGVEDTDLAGLETGGGVEDQPDGQFSEQASDLESRVLAENPGLDTRDIRVIRDGNRLTVELTERGRAKLTRQQASELEETVAEETGLGAGEILVQRDGDQLIARVNRAGARGLAAPELASQLEDRFGESFDPGEDFRTVSTAEGGVRAELTEQGKEKVRAFQKEQLARLGVQRKGFEDPDDSAVFTRADEARNQGEATAELESIVRTRMATRRELVRELEAETGVDLGPGDVDFAVEGDRVTATLTRAGRKTVAVESAELVEATGDTPLEGTPLDEAVRFGAGLGFEFDEFRRENREAFFEPIDAFNNEVIELFNLENEISQIEEAQALAQAEFEQVVPEVDIDLDEIGRGLLTAGAVGVATPEPVSTVGGAGAAVVGAGVLGAAALLQEPPRRTTATATAEVPGLFPPEQEIPEDRDLFVSELPIEEQNVFLPELQVPAVPASQLSAGRFTPPEVPVDTADPTEPFGGVEVPVDTEDPGEFGGGSELPVPSLEAQSQQVLQRGEAVQERTEHRRRGEPVDVPPELIPEGPITIGGEEGAIGGGFGIVFRRGRTRSIEPRIIETPFGDIDLAGVNPELARFLEAAERRELEAAEDRELTFDEIDQLGATEPTFDQPQLADAFEEADTIGAQAVDEDLLEPTDLDDFTGVDIDIDAAQESQVTQRQRQRTTAATTTVELTDIGVDEPIRPGFDTPFLTEEVFEPIGTATVEELTRPAARHEIDLDLEFEEEEPFEDIDFSLAEDFVLDLPDDPEAILGEL